MRDCHHGSTDLNPDVIRFIAHHDDARRLENGNVLCTLTGLQLRPHIGILSNYWGGKAYSRAKLKRDRIAYEGETRPMQPSPNPAIKELDVAKFVEEHDDAISLPSGQVLCKSTGVTFNSVSSGRLQMYWNGKHYRQLKAASDEKATAFAHSPNLHVILILTSPTPSPSLSPSLSPSPSPSP